MIKVAKIYNKYEYFRRYVKDLSFGISTLWSAVFTKSIASSNIGKSVFNVFCMILIEFSVFLWNITLLTYLLI
jgi:uncharacterized membrane protein